MNLIARTRAWIAIVFAACCAPVGRAQIDDWPRAAAPIEALVTSGRIEELEQRIGSKPPLDRDHLLARARLFRSAQATDPNERAALIERSDALFAGWIDALEKAARRTEPRSVLHLIEGRLLYANTLLALRADPALVEFEASNGQLGDRAALRALLDTCRAQYRKAEREIAPFVERGTPEEDHALAQNLEEDFRAARLDLTMNLGWTHHYLGVVHDGSPAEKDALHALAERAFSDLIGPGAEGPMKAVCHLALAIAQRDQRRTADATRNFEIALQSASAFELVARIRYELARGQIAEQGFEAARETLEPVSSRTPDSLGEAERAGRLYVQLGHLLAGASYLRQAHWIIRQRQDDLGQTQARGLREAGLARLRRVSSWGPPWPTLVRLQIAAAADLDAPLDTLAPFELLCTAQMLAESGQNEAARLRLEHAARATSADPDVRGDILFELGRVQYRLEDNRSAAATFETLARDVSRHTRAAQSATLAFQLRGRIAEQSREHADYLRLAEALDVLLTQFPDHAQRDEALWLRPRALQLAGRYGEAERGYAALPDTHPRREEARYRAVLCARDALLAERGTLDSETLLSRGLTVAEALAAYAREARGRVEAQRADQAVARWAAEALVAAGELWAMQGVDAYDRAIDALAQFERDYPGSPLLGRVLAVRIRALRGAKRFDQAGRLLAAYLERAPGAEVGPTLSSLARGMQDEVDRLRTAGRTDEAKRLAVDAAAAFAELEKWAERDARRAGQLELVQRGRLEMSFLAGDYKTALERCDALLARTPRSGPLLQQRAAILTAMLAADAPRGEIEAAQKGWAIVLADASIRKRAPERYWEARYHWLMLHARLGNAREVADAIFEESRWHADLGGETWRPRFEALYRESGGSRPLRATTTSTAPATPEPD